jgi:hypothetical protein
MSSPFERGELADAIDHKILDQPWTYEVIEVHAVFNPISQLDNTVELKLARKGEVVQLRFEGVEQLEIEAGFPYSQMGLEILDISHLGWDRLRIRVTGFEPAAGIRFWATGVTRRDHA